MHRQLADDLGAVRARRELANQFVAVLTVARSAQGHAGVLTPEDAFVAAVNTCITMMFLWTAERFRLDLVSYECEAEGTKLIELNRTEIFTSVRLRPRIVLRARDEERDSVAKQARRALQSAEKYSLVANSIKSEVRVDPVIEFVS